MGYSRRRFQRRTGTLRYKKLFVIATEGVKTEPEYFAALQTDNSVIKVHCLHGRNKSAPLQVLHRMEQHLKKEGLKDSDEAWLVADRDCWEKNQLDQLYAWSRQKENYGFALSNPKFEYWLLLHFEDAESIASSRACSERLRRHLPDYDKGVAARKINREMVDHAIRRAAGRDTNRDAGWPVTTGTTVYRLVQNILAGNPG